MLHRFMTKSASLQWRVCHKFVSVYPGTTINIPVLDLVRIWSIDSFGKRWSKKPNSRAGWKIWRNCGSHQDSTLRIAKSGSSWWVYDPTCNYSMRSSTKLIFSIPRQKGTDLYKLRNILHVCIFENITNWISNMFLNTRKLFNYIHNRYYGPWMRLGSL